MAAARITRRCVIVGPPLERVAERHPEEVRMESVEAVVQPGRRHLVEDRLTSPAAPVALADELIRDVRRQRLRELYRCARGELVALALGQERRHRLGRSRTVVM